MSFKLTLLILFNKLFTSFSDYIVLKFMCLMSYFNSFNITSTIVDLPHPFYPHKIILFILLFNNSIN
jgi:hypothetical protein